MRLPPGPMGLDGCPGDGVDDWVDVVALPQSVERREGDAHLCPERAQDELASARGAHGGEEVGVLPRVESGSVDRRAFLEQVRELGGGRLASAGQNVDRGMHDRQPRAVFASFTVDTMFFSTTSDPWTGPRRSARAGSRLRAEPHSGA